MSHATKTIDGGKFKIVHRNCGITDYNYFVLIDENGEASKLCCMSYSALDCFIELVNNWKSCRAANKEEKDEIKRLYKV